MRAMIYVALVTLALLSWSTGRWSVALAAAAIKALLVASEYMELRHAHRAHALAFAGCVSVATIALAVLATPR